MFASSRKDFLGRPRAIAYYLRVIGFAVLIAFGSLITGQCFGAEPAVGPSPAFNPDAPSDGVPTAEEIANSVRARFHVRLPDALEIGHAVLNAARRYAISPFLILAIIAVESSFDRSAVSVVGAMGLMQVLPSQHRDRVFLTSDLTDARTNVRIGSGILRDYIRISNGKLDDALYRYSGGAKGYARRVAAYFHIWKAEFGL
jgi:soluble lytic murein transglycosylase-like protein